MSYFLVFVLAFAAGFATHNFFVKRTQALVVAITAGVKADIDRVVTALEKKI